MTSEVEARKAADGLSAGERVALVTGQGPLAEWDAVRKTLVEKGLLSFEVIDPKGWGFHVQTPLGREVAAILSASEAKPQDLE